MKKLQGNGLWESSRMMLMEHRDALLNRQKQPKNMTMPVLDEQNYEQINQLLYEAYHQHKKVSLIVLHNHTQQVVTGFITKMDIDNQRILIAGKWVEGKSIIECSS